MIDLDEAVATYESLFSAALEHQARVDDQGVEAAGRARQDGARQEAARAAQRRPHGRRFVEPQPGMHHVAYQVDDVRQALDTLAAAGAG